jgi:hypothetical protein
LKRKPLSPVLENKLITNRVTNLNMKNPSFCYVTLCRWARRLERMWCHHLQGLWKLKFFFEPSTVKSLNMKDFFNFNFRTVNFVVCLGITKKCFNSYQFNTSLNCYYMFRQLCAIFRELVCTFWVTCQFGFLVDKIPCIIWLCVYRMGHKSLTTRTA